MTIFVYMQEIITAYNLTKEYGEFVAVDHISFDVRQGEIFGILGPNGAGKTTTLEMMEGLKSITEGYVLLDQLDVAKETAAVKSRIGVQLQSSAFFDGLDLLELLETFGAMYGRRVSAQSLLELVQLEDKSHSKVKELSGGQKQRLSIAVALVNDPKVIFLDEPTTGLDPQARRNLWELIRTIHREGKTLVLTTHYMDEAEILCDRIAIMDNARIIALNTTEGLVRGSGVSSRILFQSARRLPVDKLRQLPGAEAVETHNTGYVVTSKQPQQTLPALVDAMAKNNAELTDLQLKRPSLEDVFLKLTGHELRE